MRLPWDRRGTLSLKHLPDTSPKSLNALSDEDLSEFIAGWEPNTKGWIDGNLELMRRQNWPARWSIWISIAALLVSLLALFA
jgi:hypothetical protein